MGCNAAIFALAHSPTSAGLRRTKLTPAKNKTPPLHRHHASLAVGPSPSDQRASLERCLAISASPAPPAPAAPVMKTGYGALGSVTLEKSKLDLSQKTTRTSPEVPPLFHLEII